MKADAFKQLLIALLMVSIFKSNVSCDVEF